jgi:hypothetical protein
MNVFGKLTGNGHTAFEIEGDEDIVVLSRWQESLEEMKTHLRRRSER